MGKHQTLDNKVKQSMKWISSISCVSKIVIGISESCRHQYPAGFIRYKKEVRGGIKVNAYSGNGVTDIFIKIDPISEKEAFKALLLKRFSR